MPETAAKALATLAALANAALETMRSDRDVRIAMLRCVDGAGRRGMSQKDVARVLQHSDSTISRICDGLEASGLIERTAHPTDRRLKMLHLTPAGQEQLRTCAGSTTASLMQVLERTTPEERSLLARLVVPQPCASGPSRACAECRIGGCHAGHQAVRASW